MANKDEAREALQPCPCGENSLGVIHRADAPCFLYEKPRKLSDDEIDEAFSNLYESLTVKPQLSRSNVHLIARAIEKALGVE